MKILVYSHDWAPTIGGIQTAMMALARELAAPHDIPGSERVEVTLVTPTPVGGMDDGALPFAVARETGFFELVRLIREHDVIHLAGPAIVPLVLAWILRKKVVVQHHGYQAICPDGSLVYSADQSICSRPFPDGSALRCLRCHAANAGFVRSAIDVALAYPRLWLCRRAAANVAVSDYVNLRLGLSSTRTIYNGIQSSIEAGPGSAKSVASKACFAYVGRLVAEKGVAVLLRAAARLAEDGCAVRVMLIGDGPEYSSLAGLAAKLGISDRVMFTGYLEGVALADALGDVVAIVMPSICEETAGLAAIEQMMRGRLVIASQIGGLSEVVGDTGLQFPSGDHNALAACMRRAVDEPTLSRRLGMKARERALKLFTDQRMVAQHLLIYSQLLSTRMTAGRPARSIKTELASHRQRQAS